VQPLKPVGALLVVLSTAMLSAANQTVRVMSAGAIEAGLAALTPGYERDTGDKVAVQYGTGPELARRLAARERADVLIAPAAVVDQAVKDGRVVAASRVTIGRVGVGVVVRTGAARPALGSVDALRAAIAAADRLVYNQGSTGIYVEQLFGRLGLAATLQSKGVRVRNGAEVAERIIGGSGAEIGFGAITEIKMYEGRGAVLAGALPASVQHETTYDGAVLSKAAAPEAARALLSFLTAPAARQRFAATGVDVP
jgi:molybdate transport system substrate-binding protein